jgi:hypothetical protein
MSSRHDKERDRDRRDKDRERERERDRDDRRRDKEDSSKRKREDSSRRRSRSKSPPGKDRSDSSSVDSSDERQHRKKSSRSHRSNSRERDRKKESKRKDRDRDKDRDKEKGRDDRRKDKEKNDRETERGGSSSGASSSSSRRELPRVSPAESAAVSAVTDDAALDEEIRKRRERVRQWQLLRAAQEGDSGTSSSAASAPSTSESEGMAKTDAGVEDTTGMQGASEEADGRTAHQDSLQHHGWSLEDEEDDSEDDENPEDGADAEAKIADLNDYDRHLPPLETKSSDELTALPNGKNMVHNEPPPSTFAYNDSNDSTITARLNNSSAMLVSDGEDSEIDPLDEFMNSLHGVYMPEPPTALAAPPLGAPKEPASSSFGFSLPAKKQKKVSSDISAFGSNTITLEDILGSMKNDGDEVSDVNKTTDKNAEMEVVPTMAAGKGLELGLGSGWESDASIHQPSPNAQSTAQKRGVVAREDEEDEEEDAEEEAARKAFIAALRQAPVNTWNTVAAPTTKPPISAAGPITTQDKEQSEGKKDKELPTSSAAAPSTEPLGRIFAGEGDMIDEMEVYAKKRSALELLEEAKKGESPHSVCLFACLVITFAFFVQIGKELKPVDHSTIKYMEFRKNLFIIPKALARMTETELHLRREELQVRSQRHLFAVSDNY